MPINPHAINPTNRSTHRTRLKNNHQMRNKAIHSIGLIIPMYIWYMVPGTSQPGSLRQAQ